MTLSDLTSQYLPAVEDTLKSIVYNKNFDSQPELRSMIGYQMGWEGEGAGPQTQGKRLRPLLVLLSTTSISSAWQNSLPAAASVELLHNFSLVHDDVQDRSPLRRGRSSVWAKWGEAQAINVGDAMFSLAQLAMTRLLECCPLATSLDAIILLNQTCLKLTSGQYLDMSYESRNDLTLEEYWPMISGKTAALIAACTRLGALIAGATLDQQTILHNFGYQIGLAFQVQDDWLGVWGDAEISGKSSESDLASGKKSFPILFGLGKKGKFAERWQAGPIPLDEVPRMTKILADEGASDFTLTTVKQLTNRALEELSQIGPDNQGCEALRELASGLINRQA